MINCVYYTLLIIMNKKVSEKEFMKIIKAESDERHKREKLKRDEMKALEKKENQKIYNKIHTQKYKNDIICECGGHYKEYRKSTHLKDIRAL